MSYSIAHSKTPSDLTIAPRDRRIRRSARASRWWNGGDPFATAVYNALSATFPKGEAFFIESVRAFRDGVPDKLAAEIKAFISQEVAHSREHLAFNRAAEEGGYDLSKLEAAVDARLDLVRSHPLIVSLAVTCALEHFTAILAHEQLKDPVHLRGADQEARMLWEWHAVEEIEHKGVAYDSWLHATRHWTPFVRWALRSRVMLNVTRNFLKDRTAGALELLRQDGLHGPRVWARLLHYVLVRPGMLRKVFPAWLAYFRPGFHPWDRDDRALIAAAARG